MKKFFKKIAFASAMAMVVSAMPAQSAVAADGPQMYKSLKFYLGGDVTESFDDEARYAKVWNKGEYSTVTFESDNEAVATVGTKGLVTPVSVGTANITATFTNEDGDEIEKVCKVTVKQNAIEAGIGAGSAEALTKMTVGDSFFVKTYRTAADGTESWKGKDVITDSARFTSSSAKVFTVSKTGGKVTAVGAGEATLSVWAVQSEGATKDANGKVVEYKATTPVKTYPVVVEDHDRAVLSTNGVTELKADGNSQAIITFTLYKADGSLDKETTDVQVRLETTRGTLAYNYVTLENGMANVLFTSPIDTNDSVAKITAVITGAGKDGQELINIEANPVEIKLSPSVGTAPSETQTGAKLVSATAVTADRVTLYFNKEVSAAAFLANDGVTPNLAKFAFELDDQIAPTATAVAAADITGNDVQFIEQNTASSLTFIFNDSILNASGASEKVLTDNTKFAVSFTDTRYTPVQSSTYNYVTDAVTPKVLRVEVIDLKTIKVVFSEAVDFKTVASQFAIDGYALADDANTGIAATDRWGNAANRATVTRVEDSTALKMARNEWKVVLGKSMRDGALKQNYFEAGTHSVTVYNVKDHAGLSDGKNVVASQTLDFYVAANDVLPSFDVEVMSPEQYLVTFNCQLDMSEAQVKAVLQLKYSDRSNNSAYADVSGLNQTYDCVEIDAGKKYLIEVKTDWTTALNGKVGNNGANVPFKDTNYYNYSFRIDAAANSLINAANGKTNTAAIEKTLDTALNGGIMKVVDATVPEITGTVVEKTQGVNYEITFSEPVQISNLVNGALLANAGNITASTQQVGGVPETTVYIVSADLKTTYAATITGINRLNNVATVTVNAPNALSPATDYILYVRNATDDIGNSANTIVKNFTTPGVNAPANDFVVEYVKADTKFNSADGVTALDVYDATDLTMDALYVKFSKDFAKAGGVATVLNNTNWTINGQALPTGAVVITGIYGEAATVPGVTILLPNGTITDIEQTVVTISGTVTDKDGNALKGDTRFVTQFVK